MANGHLEFQVQILFFLWIWSSKANVVDLSLKNYKDKILGSFEGLLCAGIDWAHGHLELQVQIVFYIWIWSSKTNVVDLSLKNYNNRILSSFEGRLCAGIDWAGYWNYRGLQLNQQCRLCCTNTRKLILKHDLRKLPDYHLYLWQISLCCLNKEDPYPPSEQT